MNHLKTFPLKKRYSYQISEAQNVHVMEYDGSTDESRLEMAFDLIFNAAVLESISKSMDLIKVNKFEESDEDLTKDLEKVSSTLKICKSDPTRIEAETSPELISVIEDLAVKNWERGLNRHNVIKDRVKNGNNTHFSDEIIHNLTNPSEESLNYYRNRIEALKLIFETRKES